MLFAAIWPLCKRHRDIKGRTILRSLSYTAGGLSLVLGLGSAVNWYTGWAPNWNAARIRLGLGDGTRAHAETAERAPSADKLGVSPVISGDVPLARPSVHPANGLANGNASQFALPAPASLNLADNTVWVYTPPGYDRSGAVAYPVIYLIHGSPGSSSDWIAAGAATVLDQMIASGDLAPVIAVTPAVGALSGSDSGCLDSTKPGGSRIETFLFEVVKPWVENHFPVSPDRRANAIGGMSMGGYCAVDQGLRHSDQLATLLAIMPYGSPGAAGKKMKSSPTEIDAVTPLKYIPTAKDIADHSIAIWFGVPGAEEAGQVGQDTAAMAKSLRARGQVVEKYTAPGQRHTWKMAIGALPIGLRFWQRQLDGVG
ncbi:MAG: esterase family protein [Bifidobacteriaceae bacterium]|nr:esterase family protein [Bifidobacteriaceae bacterium]